MRSLSLMHPLFGRKSGNERNASTTLSLPAHPPPLLSQGRGVRHLWMVLPLQREGERREGEGAVLNEWVRVSDGVHNVCAFQLKCEDTALTSRLPSPKSIDWTTFWSTSLLSKSALPFLPLPSPTSLACTLSCCIPTPTRCTWHHEQWANSNGDWLHLRCDGR